MDLFDKIFDWIGTFCAIYLITMVLCLIIYELIKIIL